MLPLDQLQSSYQGAGAGGGAFKKLAPSLFKSAGRQQSTRPGTDSRGGSLASVSWPLVQKSRPIPVSKTPSATAMMEASTCSQTSTHNPAVDLGYDKDIDAYYNWGKQLGQGGNGVVRIVTDNNTGEEFACKSVKKVLADASDKKRAGHLDSLKREIDVLRRLSGSLNVVKLIDVFEDEDQVHIVQEYCKGGELWHRIGDKHYSERTVSQAERLPVKPSAVCWASALCWKQ